MWINRIGSGGSHAGAGSHSQQMIQVAIVEKAKKVNAKPVSLGRTCNRADQVALSRKQELRWLELSKK